MLATSHRLYLCWKKTAMAWPHVGQRCVSGLRSRRGSRLSERLLGGCNGGGSPLRGSFAKRSDRLSALSSLGGNIGGGRNKQQQPSFWIRLSWMLEWSPVARMIPWDRRFYLVEHISQP